MTAGRPMISSACSVPAWRSASVAPSTITDGAYGWPMRSSRSRNALAVLGHLDGLDGRAQQARPVALQEPRARDVHGQVERRSGRPARRGCRPGRSRSRMRSIEADRERLEVDRVRDAGVGHDRGRVGVEQDGAHALLAQRAAGLGAGVVELGRLADDHGPGADDEHRRAAWRRTASTGATPHARLARRPRSAGERRTRVQEPVEHLDRIERAGRSLGVVLDRLDGQRRVAQTLDAAVVEVALADHEARSSRAASRRPP